MEGSKKTTNIIGIILIIIGLIIIGGGLYFFSKINFNNNEENKPNDNNNQNEVITLDTNDTLVQKLYNMVAVSGFDTNTAYSDGLPSSYIAYKNLPKEVIESKDCTYFGYDSSFSINKHHCGVDKSGDYVGVTSAIKGETFRNKMKEIYGQDVRYTDHDFTFIEYLNNIYHYDAKTDYYVLLSFLGGGYSDYDEKKQLESATKQNNIITLIEHVDAYYGDRLDSSSSCKYTFKYEEVTKNYIFTARSCETI